MVEMQRKPDPDGRFSLPGGTVQILAERSGTFVVSPVWNSGFSGFAGAEPGGDLHPQHAHLLSSPGVTLFVCVSETGAGPSAPLEAGRSASCEALGVSLLLWWCPRCGSFSSAELPARARAFPPGVVELSGQYLFFS